MKITLHHAIERLIREIGRPMKTQEIANALNKNRWYTKKDESEITAFQIHGRTKNYPGLFKRDGSIVSLANANPVTPKAAKSSERAINNFNPGLKKTEMKHSVRFSIPDRELGNADIEFKVKKSGKRFGTLKVSKGSIVWVQRDNTYGYKMNWYKFDELLQKEGKDERKR